MEDGRYKFNRKLSSNTSNLEPKRLGSRGLDARVSSGAANWNGPFIVIAFTVRLENMGAKTKLSNTYVYEGRRVTHPCMDHGVVQAGNPDTVHAALGYTPVRRERPAVLSEQVLAVGVGEELDAVGACIHGAERGE